MTAPARLRLADARACVAGIADPAEAWERLATQGVIPAEWVQCPTRVFADPIVGEPVEHVSSDPRTRETVVRLVALQASGMRRWIDGRIATLALQPSAQDQAVWATKEQLRHALKHGCTNLPQPASVEQCIALASDVPGVLAAEEIARALAGEMGQRVRRIVWQTRRGPLPPQTLAWTFEWLRRLRDIGYHCAGIAGGIATLEYEL